MFARTGLNKGVSVKVLLEVDALIVGTFDDRLSIEVNGRATTPDDGMDASLDSVRKEAAAPEPVFSESPALEIEA